MRKSYAVAVELGTRCPIQLKDVASATLEWLSERSLNFGDSAVERLMSNQDGWDVGDSHVVDTRFHDGDGGDAWAVRLSHPDGEDERIQWTASLAARETGANTAWLSCQLTFGARDGTVLPVRRESSRPRIILELVKKYGARNGLPTRAKATRIGKEDAQPLVELLEDTSRRLPVVFLSAANSTDRPIVNADKVAEILVGVAHVYVARDRFATLHGLDNYLPKRLLAFDGAIRVYWPGFSVQDQSYVHRYWRRESVHDRKRVQQQILGVVSAATIGVTHPEAPTWEQVNRLHRNAIIAEARSRGDADELLELYEAENSDLARQSRDLELRVAELEDDLSEARAQRDSWRQNYQLLVKGEGSDEEADEVPPIETVTDAIDLAMSAYADRLIISLNNKSDGEDNLYEEPLKLYQALGFLAGTYADARLGVARCTDFDTPLRTLCGWKWLGPQSASTMGQFRDWYRTRHEGSFYDLDLHIGTRSAKDARYTMRIGFTWIEAEQKVLVGFIGQHQKTSAT